MTTHQGTRPRVARRRTYRQSSWCSPGHPYAQLPVSRIAQTPISATTSACRVLLPLSSAANTQATAITGGATLQYGS